MPNFYRFCKSCEVHWIGDVDCWCCGEPHTVSKGPVMVNSFSPVATAPVDPKAWQHGQLRVLP